MCTAIIRVRRRTSGRLWWTWWGAFGFHKRQGINRLLTASLSSCAGLCCVSVSSLQVLVLMCKVVMENWVPYWYSSFSNWSGQLLFTFFFLPLSLSPILVSDIHVPSFFHMRSIRVYCCILIQRPGTLPVHYRRYVMLSVWCRACIFENHTFECLHVEIEMYVYVTRHAVDVSWPWLAGVWVLFVVCCEWVKSSFQIYILWLFKEIKHYESF